MSDRAMWERFKQTLLVCDDVGLTLDVSRTRLDAAFIARMAPAIEIAFTRMDELEAGAIANPDEKRMVGHYWLRDPARAPRPEIRREIEQCVASIKRFARAVHAGRIKPPKGKAFRHVLVIGIGGSALGPRFVARALGSPARDRLRPWFLDNTDPDGFDLVLGELGDALRETLVVVISKSGGTPETRNGMLETHRLWDARGLRFGAQAVAITQKGSDLDRYATEHGFVARFPMWDWVGGRTSELSAVGLVPAALQGIAIDELLAGARRMDAVTRRHDVGRNPAAQLALTWYEATDGRGAKDMVILPYKDRLELFSRYLQQLVMESLGKERDLGGAIVHQGLTVYGNKGSTDQHAYVQQLRDGVPNFFVTFIEVLRDRAGRSPEVDAGVTSGDYLSGFQQGTRQALWESGRESVTITVPDVSAATVGMLIALYERTVGFYATLVNVNAYHQPGVEAGKKAAAGVLAIQQLILDHFRAHPRDTLTVEKLADAIGAPNDTETVFKVLQHLSANPDHGVRRQLDAGASIFDARYSAAQTKTRRAR